jgi:hypothetical protein
LVEVAVKITDVPEQTGFADTATDTLTGSNGFTVTLYTVAFSATQSEASV